jgi:hypothetical protein
MQDRHHVENVGSSTPERSANLLNCRVGAGFAGRTRTDKYAWIERVLVEQHYTSLSKEQRGGVRTKLSTGAGLSLPQITRLIRRYRQTGQIGAPGVTRRRFPPKYTADDVQLLVEVDRAHPCLSGPATRRVLQREWRLFDNQEFARLSEISLAHLYNFRNSAAYRRRMAELPRTAQYTVAMAEGRRTEPKATPGYLRVAAAGPADWEGAKGLYHVIAVDAATQWTLVACAAGIDAQSLLPVLETMRREAPFRILGFHTESEAEFEYCALAKLLLELAQRRSDGPDRVVGEGNNRGIICPGVENGPLLNERADRIQRFYTEHLNQYLNYHRPRGFGRIRLDERGRRCRRYGQEDYLTPHEKLRSLPGADRHIKDGMRWELLDGVAHAHSDTEAARRMMRAWSEVLHACKLEPRFLPRFLF